MFTIELVLVLFYFSNLLLGLQCFTKLDRILLSWSGINKKNYFKQFSNVVVCLDKF